jgi:hypothetical protein
MKRFSAALAMATLIMLAISSGVTARKYTEKIAKQGTSGGDSLGTAADTSAITTLDKSWTLVKIVAAASDTAFSWYVEGRPPNAADTTTWIRLTATDTVVAGGAAVESAVSADLIDYIGWDIRVIQDNLGSAAQAFGRVFILQDR